MSAFGALAEEAVRDASRRRIVAMVVAMSLLSLFFIDGCTSCASGTININGEERSLGNVAGATGGALYGFLGLWIVLLAGVLAADHLRQSLEDGSADLSLARPISRDAFALSRLVGSLAVALGTGAVLLGATAFLLGERSALPLGPAFVSALGVFAGAVTLGAFGMAFSLWLPRLAAILAVAAGLGIVVLANTLSFFREESANDLLGWIDRFGPPLATAIWLPLDKWIPQAQFDGDPVAVGVRAVIWAAVAVGLLLLSFRRLELGR
jgi:hypothetical protein